MYIYLYLFVCLSVRPQYMRSVWMAAETRVRICDELAMAAERLRLASPEEARMSMRNPVVILPEEVGGGHVICM